LEFLNALFNKDFSDCWVWSADRVRGSVLDSASAWHDSSETILLSNWSQKL